MAERENFYILLELDPKVDDWSVIEQRITEKKRSWSKDRSQGNPKARRSADRNLALITEIESVLKDPETRRHEAREARKRQEELRKQQVRDLDDAIAVLRSGDGTCDEIRLKQLVKQHGKFFSEDEIKKRLRAAGVSIGSSAGKRSKRPARPKIDAVTAKNISGNLDHLGLETLYDFLELGRSSSPQALSDRAEEIYKENRKLGKTDSETSARNQLAGICKSVFSDDQEKDKYDSYLAVAAMDSIKGAIELAGADRFITEEELGTLVKQAMQRGVSAEDARDYIEEYAANRKWGVQQKGRLPIEDLKLCGFCSTPAAPDASTCSECGEPLELSCPRCSTRVPTRYPACTNCGCRTGDAPLVKALLKEGERLALDGDLTGADRCFARVLHYWPGWAEAEEARNRVERNRQAREQDLTSVSDLIRQSRLMAAHEALERFERSYGKAGVDSIRQRIRQGISDAEAAFKKGEQQRRRGDTGGALDRYDQALAVCIDYEPARQAMAKSPPPSPVDLSVTSVAGGFRLSWKAAAGSRSAAFQVRRKAGGVAQSIDDGELVGEVMSSSVDDTSAVVGEPLYYAVFAVRSGIACHSPVSSGPHLRTAEVDCVEAVAGSREVTLRWQSPPGCRRIEVWRKQGKPPQRRGEGTAVPVAGSSAHDTNLSNGTTYGYLIVALYDDPSKPGKELSGTGHTLTAIPVAPPEPVNDLKCSRQGSTVTLSWSPIAGANVQIRQASKVPEGSSGLILPVSEIDRFGSVVTSSSRNGAQTQLTSQGRVFFVPISVAEGTAVVGRAVSVTSLDPVTKLSSRRSGRRIELSWEWPPGLDVVMVCIGYDHFPEEPDSGKQIRVTRKEYQRSGCWCLSHAEQKRHYFSVFAMASGDLYAPAAQVLESMGHAVTVSYQAVVKRHLLLRKIEEARIDLRCNDRNHPSLPAMVVVAKHRSVPMSPRDGQVLLEVPGIHFKGGHASISIPERHWRDQGFVKLFFKDAAQAREVRLLPAAKERLRLG